MAKKNKKVDNRKLINIKDYIKEVDIGVKNKVFTYTSPLSVNDLSEKLSISAGSIIKYFFLSKPAIILNVNSILSKDQIAEVCLENDLDFQIDEEINYENVIDLINFEKEDNAETLKPRSPIVTIMGHVDHGKTTLLDSIRKTSVVDSEAGGITQHIGAYQVETGEHKITFIDTPGHEIFSEMRARGANITDIIVLVIGADDGLKPQTEEAIDHAKAAKVPLIVFINKMDKENANPEKILSMLNEKNVISEEWGGDTIVIKGSAKVGTGLNELLEAILLTSEMLELKANPDRFANGVVIESNLDKGFGPVATVLIKGGTLNKNDFVVVGSSFGKIKIMHDENNKILLKAGPSQPVRIAGLDIIPELGTNLLAFNNEKEAKKIADIQKNKINNLTNANSQNSEIRAKIISGEYKNINLIIKTDFHGSLEAVKAIISRINVNGATTTIIRAATGGITESEVKLAQSSKSFIIGFNIRPNKNVLNIAKQTNVEILTFDIIYKLKDEIENILKGSLDIIYSDNIIGEAKILQIWRHSDVGTICGVKVDSGKIVKGAKARVIRDNVVIYTSEIKTLKTNKEPVNEVKEGRECGFTIKNFNDLKEGDVIEIFEVVGKKQYE